MRRPLSLLALSAALCTAAAARIDAGHQQRKNTIISRQLAFVILGAVTMYRATGSDHYRQQIGRLCRRG